MSLPEIRVGCNTGYDYNEFKRTKEFLTFNLQKPLSFFKPH